MRQLRQCGVHGRDGCPILRDEGGCERVARGIGRHHAVDGQLLVCNADRGELARGACGFGEGRAMRARDQDEPGFAGVCQPIDGLMVTCALLFESGERTEAGRVALSGLQKPGPCAGKLEQPDRMTCRSGIEDDMVVTVDDAVVGQQRREFIESRDLGGAGAGELFLDALQRAFQAMCRASARRCVRGIRRRPLRD